MNEIRFSEAKVVGGQLVETNVRMIKQSDIGKCPFAIFIPSHYREGGSCKCNNKEERKMMIKEWGYEKGQFKGIPLVD